MNTKSGVGGSIWRRIIEVVETDFQPMVVYGQLYP